MSNYWSIYFVDEYYMDHIGEDKYMNDPYAH
jgi:hypothetical protein